jgi:hypothetical protein
MSTLILRLNWAKVTMARDYEREKLSKEREGHAATTSELEEMTKARDNEKMKLTIEEKAHVATKTELKEMVKARDGEGKRW